MVKPRRSLRAAAFGVVTALATAAAMAPAAHAQTAVQSPPGGITRILVKVD
jgi:hypothetical protein